MRFFIDECVSPPLSHHLNKLGLHDAIHPRDRGRLREPDRVVFARAIAEDRIVVTENAEDFRKLAAAAPRDSSFSDRAVCIGCEQDGSSLSEAGSGNPPDWRICRSTPRLSTR